MARIFIVSRQYDSDQMVYQLDQHLRLVFGSSRVAALNRLAPGADVRLEIARYIQASNVVLVVIGRRWVGHPGLHHASDPVHLAVRTALEMPGKTVIPVLVDGAIPPDASELPSGLQALAYRTALNLRYEPDFSADAAYLVAAIQQIDTQQQNAPEPDPQVQQAPAPRRAIQPLPPPEFSSSPAPRSSGSNPFVAIVKFIVQTVSGVFKFFAGIINTIIHQMLRSTIALVMNIVLMLLIGSFSVVYVSELLQNGFDFGLAFSATIDQIRTFVSSLFGG